MNYNFELGPIRPPSEAHSILLRVTRNCPWNRCAFCPVYKKRKFSPRKVDEVIQDIDAVAFITEKITGTIAAAGGGGEDNLDLVGQLAAEENIDRDSIHQVIFWLRCGMKSLFLQDADSLVIKSGHLVKILNHIREKFPSIERVTSYSRAKTLSKKSLDELKKLRTAGLDRVHIGMESGSAKVLEKINKGVTPAEQVLAGKNAVAAGFELSEYFMPGIGGAELSQENAVESAKVLNQVNPTFIRLRTTRVIKGTPLHQMMVDKKWTPLSEIEKITEIKLFIENLKGIESKIVSDHIMNLIEEVEGRMPEDKDKILKVLDKFLKMKTEDKESFIVGRRLGRFRFLSDYTPSARIEKIKAELKSRFSSLEEAIHQVAQNY